MKTAGIERLEGIILKYLEHLAAINFSTRTIEAYRYHLRSFTAYLQKIGLEELGQIGRETVSQYQLHLHSRPGPRGELVSLETQGARLVALRSLFRYMVRRGYMLFDPSAELTLPKRKKNLPRGVMSSKEVFKILNQPDVDTPLGLRDKAILEVLYSSGIRNAELRALKVSDIDTVCHEVRIQRGKGGKDRVVPLGEIAGKYVDEYIRTGRPKIVEYAQKVLKKGDSHVPELFISRGCKRLTCANLITLVSKYAARAGMSRRITCHGFRHTCATHLLKGRASLRHIQQLLGHGTIATTQIYTQVETGDLKREHRRCHPREQDR